MLVAADEPEDEGAALSWACCDDEGEGGMYCFGLEVTTKPELIERALALVDDDDLLTAAGAGAKLALASLCGETNPPLLPVEVWSALRCLLIAAAFIIEGCCC